MPITYKLVGISKEQVNNEMKHLGWNDESTSVNINNVTEFFQSKGCTEGIEQVKFITDSQTMIPEKDYQVSKDKDRLIYVFTQNAEIRKSIISIFNQHGYSVEKKVEPKPVEQSLVPIQPLITKPIPEDEIRIDESIVTESNKETIRLFGESDFKTLLRIYINNPDMFKTFASYVSSGTVISTAIVKPDEEQDYSEQKDAIMGLNLGVDEELIDKALNRFNGHINLSLRFILTYDSMLNA